MKKLLLMLFALITTGAWAQTDVTNQYITNAGFDTESDFQTSNVATGGSNQRKDVTGWTNSGGDTYSTGAAIGFGTSGQINGASLPSTNENGTTTGGALCLNAAWASQVWYTQNVTLPAGNYAMTFAVNNVGKNAQFEKDPVLFSFTTSDGSSFSGNVHSYPVNTWTTQTINFALASETEGTIKIGYKAANTGSGNTPKLVVDYVKATYNSNYTATLQSAIDRATILNARASDSDLATAITTAQGVLDGADNTVAYQTTIDDAVTTLRDAINTAAAKVVLLEGENVTFMFENADFESGTPVTVGITTYDYDAATNGTSFSRMQVVEGWTIGENGNAKSAGVYKFGQDPFLGSQGDNYKAPTSGSAAGEEKALGIVAVWSSTAQYKQACTLPAGSYIIEVPVYNTAGTTAFSKNLIGFVENSGTEHLATAKTYATGSWITEKVIFELENETAGYLSLGYTAANQGSSAMPHLFIDGVKVTYTSPIAAAYQRYQNALTAANDAISNSDYVNVTGNEKTALQDAIAATPEATKEGYNTAADNLDTAREAFVNAKDSYDAYVAAKAITYDDNLPYASADKKSALDTALNGTPNTAEDAASKAAAITTALRAYYESNALAEGVEGAVDMTDKVSAANADTNTGWTNGIGTNQGQGYTAADGTVAAKYLDGGWAQNAGADIDMTRSVEIPAGKYLLTVTARGAAALDEYTLSIGGVTVNLPKNGGNGGVFGNGWDDVSVEFETDGSAQTLEVKATSTASQQWMSINRFRLVRLELFTEMANEEDYAALTAAIEAAEAKPLGFDEGEYAPYNNVEVIKAIATAKTIDTNAENEKAEVLALTETLTNGWVANTTEVDAIFDGQFATTEPLSESGKVVLPGWTKVEGIRLLVKDETVDPGLAYTDGKAAVFSWGGTTLTYGEQVGYTLPLNKHELYELTLKVSGWRDGDMPNVVTIALDGASQTVNAQELGAKAINVSEGNPFATLKFYVTPTADNSKLTIYANHHFTIADLSMNLAVAEELSLSDATTFEQTEEKYANVTISRSIKEGLNTVVLPFALDATQVATMFGEGAEVYAYSESSEDANNATVNFNKKEEATIEANVPVLVKATAASTSQTVEGVIVKTAEAKVAGTNFDFVGVYAPMTVAEGDYFVSGGKLYKSKGATNLKGFRAYIQNKGNATGEVKLNIDGVATSIEAIENGQLTTGNEAIYNLAGQRVSKATRGIYVKNGRKVVIK